MRLLPAVPLAVLLLVDVGQLAVAQNVERPVEVAWRPQVPLQGSLVVLGVRVPAGRTALDVRGVLAGELLHFERVGDWFHAVGGVPLSAHNRVVARIVIERAAGASDTVLAILPVAVRKAQRERLSADPDLVQPPESVLPRIRAERVIVRQLKERAHEGPRLWREPFTRPRPGPVSSGFGGARVFNGVTRSRHLGVDFSAAVGEPVRAANRGVVTFAGGLYYSGNTIFLDHGGGLVTAYLHLSRALVARGDTVSAGQLIGRVGATGRVTGPNLHWLASYGNVMVDPMDLLTIDPAAPLGEALDQTPR
ncbi:MAG TPA: M23 family metallopeptidase [Gemmatimonadales bacterium]